LREPLRVYMLHDMTKRAHGSDMLTAIASVQACTIVAVWCKSRCDGSSAVATHDSCTHGVSAEMGDAGGVGGDVGWGVVRGCAWAARGRWSKKLCYVMLC
jgi:hypothetical protein